MPIYDGNKISTGILYENGNIITKSRIPAENPTDQTAINNFVIQAARKKNKTIVPLTEADQVLLGDFSIMSGRKDKKMFTVTMESDPIVEIGSFSIKGANKKTSIVVG